MLVNDDFEDKDFKSIVSGMCLYLDNAELYPLYTQKSKNLAKSSKNAKKAHEFSKENTQNSG